MRRWTGIAMSFGLSLLGLIGLHATAAAPFHIGVVTCTNGYDPGDESRGAVMLIKEYGLVGSGGMVRHLAYRDEQPPSEQSYIASLVSLADDPELKAIIVSHAIAGTAEGFRQVQAKRPDILCLASEPLEDAVDLSTAADMVVSLDFLARGYTLAWAAKQMGAQTLVHCSFPRHMADLRYSRRCQIMEKACKDLGIRFGFETVPDTHSDVGMASARDFYPFEKLPAWLRKYGPNGERVAFFCTDDKILEFLLDRVMRFKNSLLIEANSPSLLGGYARVLGLDPAAEPGEIPALLQKEEDAVIAKGGEGRIGAWAYPYGMCATAGLGEYAIRVIKGKARKNNLKDVIASYAKWTPGAGWNGEVYTDPDGHELQNYLLVYTDTYIFGGLNGQHFLRTTRVKVPAKYLTMKSKYATP